MIGIGRVAQHPTGQEGATQDRAGAAGVRRPSSRRQGQAQPVGRPLLGRTLVHGFDPSAGELGQVYDLPRHGIAGDAQGQRGRGTCAGERLDHRPQLGFLAARFRRFHIGQLGFDFIGK